LRNPSEIFANGEQRQLYRDAGNKQKFSSALRNWRGQSIADVEVEYAGEQQRQQVDQAGGRVKEETCRGEPPIDVGRRA
jgi:hypothetical protein